MSTNLQLLKEIYKLTGKKGVIFDKEIIVLSQKFYKKFQKKYLPQSLLSLIKQEFIGLLLWNDEYIEDPKKMILNPLSIMVSRKKIEKRIFSIENEMEGLILLSDNEWEKIENFFLVLINRDEKKPIYRFDMENINQSEFPIIINKILNLTDSIYITYFLDYEKDESIVITFEEIEVIVNNKNELIKIFNKIKRQRKRKSQKKFIAKYRKEKIDSLIFVEGNGYRKIIINENYKNPIEINTQTKSWECLFQIAKKGNIHFEKYVIDYFNSNKKCKIYTNTGYKIQRILKQRNHLLEKNINQLYIISQKTFERRRKALA